MGCAKEALPCIVTLGMLHPATAPPGRLPQLPDNTLTVEGKIGVRRLYGSNDQAMAIDATRRQRRMESWESIGVRPRQVPLRAKNLGTSVGTKWCQIPC
jgi:hypothetical protein